MIVVADTSPLNYLVLIDEIALLPALFQKVLIPPAVLDELRHPGTSSKVRNWLAENPDWLELCHLSKPVNAKLLSLDPGEQEAIQLALERNIGTVLLDEAAGRRIVQELGLEARGTLGILERGAKLGLTQFASAFHKLEQTNFRISPALKAALLSRNG
ncbi:MAG TPA: hypothetical protein VIM62_00680 [Acidobacteriaceae bacterium]